ncbi:MAG: glycosyltransferase family 2 protein [Bacteroidia bacterium]|nr:glycosyltransferase family 2 protein [Bacteroidia bacterium]MCX7764366.1 glycosyltransferase family 2 protein [Bacteroidia bacterium]
MELSAVLITYNAAKHLQRTLKALHEVADEIIIVDSGSQDGTKAIALQFPKVRWFERPFEGYGQQKNYANSLARGRYILSVDADEELSPELRQAILQEKGYWKADAYRMLRVAIYCGAEIRAGDWYPDWKVRLFRRDIGRWSEDPVHERLIIPKGSKVAALSGEMWHYTYDTPEENLLRTSKYARLQAEFLYKSGYKSSWARGFFRFFYRFVKSLFLKGGWRLGWRGVSIAFLGAVFYPLREIYLAEKEAQATEALSHGASVSSPNVSPDDRNKSMPLGSEDQEAHPLS